MIKLLKVSRSLKRAPHFLKKKDPSFSQKKKRDPSYNFCFRFPYDYKIHLSSDMFASVSDQLRVSMAVLRSRALVYHALHYNAQKKTPKGKHSIVNH